MSDREANLLDSVTTITWRFYLWVGVLSAVVLWGLFAYVRQVSRGLVVTGMGDQISWGLYITNFVFFLGLAKGGTLISASLRLFHAEWRRPITRLAEAVTVFALCIGGPMVVVDLGRPDRMLNLFRYTRIQSTIVWDVLGISTYFIASLVYLYLPMIPDLAALASQPGPDGWRRRLYKKMALGWRGTKEQSQCLDRAIGVMTVIVIPLAISLPTSWIFAMTLRPGWNSAIFGPYFIIAGLYSGCAIIIISLYVLRKIFRLEDYVEQKHFRNMGTVLLVFSLFFLWFNVSEYFSMGYKSAGPEKGLLQGLFTGSYAPYFWTSELLTPFSILLLLAVVIVKRWRQYIIPGSVLASVFVVVALWLERYVIVIPTLSTPPLPIQGIPPEWMHYSPSWVEWSITTAAFAAFLLVYSLLSKLFPMISIWETREMETVPVREPRAVSRVGAQPYMPPTVSMLILACILTAAVAAHAEETHPTKPRKAIAISLQGQIVPSVNPQAAGPEGTKSPVVPPNRLLRFGKRLFNALIFRPDTSEGEKPFPAMALQVALRDEEGKPVGYQAVRFSLVTSFGSELEFGSSPTNEEGKVQLVINDRRCGKYRVKAVYAGNDANSPASAEAPADFGPCPSPALPDSGILITPYPTPAITLPILSFYGLTWVAVLYSLVYLAFWRIRRSGEDTGAPRLP